MVGRSLRLCTASGQAHRRASKAALAFFLFLLLIPCGACTSLGGFRQVASIDSVPRGLDVRDPEDADVVLGTTPFFLSASRQRSLALAVDVPEKRGLAQYRFQCSFRWTSVLLGNSPLASLAFFVSPWGGAVAYSLGLTTDLMTGAAYQCPERYLLDPVNGVALNPARTAQSLGNDSEPPSDRLKNTCKRYFVLPPYHPDEVVSRAYEDIWRQEFKKELGSCDELVDADESRSLLVRYNITHERAFDDVTEFSVAQTNAFGFRTKATHFVVVRAVATRLSSESDQVDFQWDVFDLHTRKKVGKKGGNESLSVRHSGTSLVERATWRKAITWTLGLVPNSVGFALGNKTLEVREGEKVEKIIRIRTRPSLPALISNWTLLSVYHPYQYGTWALDLDFHPEAIFYYFDQEMDFALRDERQLSDYQSDGFYGVGLANVKGTVHSPVGALTLGAGLGPVFIAVADSEGYQKTTVRLVRAVQIDYTAFMTENFFLRLGVAVFYGNDTIDTGYVRFRVNSMSSVTIGVFAPEARSWMRSLF